MDMGKLSGQFSEVMERAASMGIEMPPEMPGMAKIGGLHVPVSDARIFAHAPDKNQGMGPGLVLGIPDEKGNIYSLRTVEREATGPRMWGLLSSTGESPHSDIEFDSADEFADIYGKVPEPSDRTREVNVQDMNWHRSISEKMGVGPGMMPGFGFGFDPDPADVVFDPATGDVHAGKMSYSRATTEAVRERKQKEEQRRQMRGGL